MQVSSLTPSRDRRAPAASYPCVAVERDTQLGITTNIVREPQQRKEVTCIVPQIIILDR